MEIGLKFPEYKKYHLHAFVDTGSGFSLAKKFAIPEEYWTKDLGKSDVGRTIEGRHILMNTIAKKIKITIGGGDFIIEELWQSENQDADILLGNEFILQQTFIQKTPINLIGFEKGDKIFWTERLKHARSVVGPGFTSQYQKSQQNHGDLYKPKFEEILQYKQYRRQEEVLQNEEFSEEDEEEINEEISFVREHNLKYFETKLEQQKKHTVGEIKDMLKQNIDINPLKFWEKDQVVWELKLHDMNVICHVKAIPQYKEEDQK
ncbi:hypothetical protein ACLB2K_056599 [Fragaria x ananassa]